MMDFFVFAKGCIWNVGGEVEEAMYVALNGANGKFDLG